MFGLEVGCEYRWPYDHAHPGCWSPPLKGTVLALDDTRAWTNTLAFPGSMYPDGPPQDKVTAHVRRCQGEGLLTESVPVLYHDTEGKAFIQWDRITSLRPYPDEHKRWQEARAARYAEYGEPVGT